MTALDPGPRQEILGDHALFPGMSLPRERAAQDPVQRIRPRSPRPLTRESVAARVDASPTVELTARVQSIWDQGVRESCELAESLAALAPSWRGRDSGGCSPEDAQCEDLLVAAALRCSDTVAYRRIRDGHRGLDLLPLVFARLRAGEFPAAWFRELLRRTLGLTDEEMALVDATVSAWDPGITSEHFNRCLGTVVATLLERRELPPHLDVEARRRVEFEHDGDDGTACLQIVGPVPEILQLARRLDDAARTVQAAQRHALEGDAEIPLDPQGRAAAQGRPLSLSELRYHLLTTSELNTDGVGLSAASFRMNVTVPLLTLMGHSDAPGMLDGRIPIPADMARELAAGEDAWYRLLTDPVGGEFLPAPAERYSAPKAMREHLRVRMTTCAVPGCRRPASCATEADHIEEYDHEDPLHGGRTSVDNLHLLCWKHHALKTARRIDPVRVDASHSPTGRTGTLWSIDQEMRIFQEDDTDLATPAIVQDLEDSWARIIAQRAQHEAARREQAALEERRRRERDECARAARETAERLRAAAADGVPPEQPPPDGAPPSELPSEPPSEPPDTSFFPGPPPPF